MSVTDKLNNWLKNTAKYLIPSNFAERIATRDYRNLYTFYENYENYTEEQQYEVFTKVGHTAAKAVGKTLTLDTKNQKANFMWLTKAAIELSKRLPSPTVYPYAVRYTNIRPQIVIINDTPVTDTTVNNTGEPNPPNRRLNYTHGFTHLYHDNPHSQTGENIIRGPNLYTLITLGTHFDNALDILAVLMHELTHLTEGGIYGHDEDFVKAMAHAGITYNHEARTHTLSQSFYDACVELYAKLGPFPGTFVRDNHFLARQKDFLLFEGDFDTAPFALRERKIRSTMPQPIEGTTLSAINREALEEANDAIQKIIDRAAQTNPELKEALDKDRERVVTMVWGKVEKRILTEGERTKGK